MKVVVVLITFFSASVNAFQNGGVAELTSETFDNLAVSNLAVVEFFAPWCHYCKQFAPVYQEIAAQALSNGLDIFFAKVDCDGRGKQLCNNLNVKFLPTIKVFSNGKSLGDYNGSRQPAKMLEFLSKAANSPNDLALLMADDMGAKMPSNVTPWHADQKSH
ncbi:thioredoxin domain-containing protein 5-like isoform X2 [Acropora muricata]|uniref:protein disulfide isomerase-like 1-2 n=1 Tax=Acropora millepora TaxID=45264 RepID=UPI001CF4AD0D|nr:protein disulfide isomerase-like 1-2 [Acropora millepora]